MNSKICTSLEQSKKLIELGIDINTADMCYRYRWSNNSFINLPYAEKAREPITGDIPAWSLAALLEVMPNGCLIKNINGKYKVLSNSSCVINDAFNNPVDACYEMIIKLHEQKLL